MRWDYVIVGAGLYGATFARLAADAGKRVLVLERRAYIGGNVADYQHDSGVLVNRHGGHIFHTNHLPIWQFVNRFTEFWPYRHRVKANYQGNVYSFPVNLLTFAQVYGVTTPAEARRELDGERVPDAPIDNFEGWCLMNIGPRLYRMFFEGYTRKQWQREPRDLPASIARRIPIRYTYDDDYFIARYQGLPVGGYSRMVDEMLRKIPVELSTDYLGNREYWHSVASTIVYSGPLDELYDNCYGALDYRSLRWRHEVVEGDYQGCATMNYTDSEVKYTRILEWAHFMPRHPGKGLVSWEYAQEWQPGMTRYYPINDDANQRRAAQYMALAKSNKIVLGGRLGTYTYLNMDQAIGQAMKAAKEALNGST